MKWYKILNFYSKNHIPKPFLSLETLHEFIKHLFASARQHDVMVADGPGKEVGGIGRVVECDALLGAAQVGQLQVFEQLAFGGKMAFEVTRRLK